MLFPELIPVAETAALLWQKGWAERNGGNMVVRVDSSHLVYHPVVSVPIPIGASVPHLKGMHFYCKGSGHRMRDVAKSPLEHGSIIRILDDAEHYAIVFERPIRPTSEITAHLLIHNQMVANASPNKVSLHTHPTTLVALSHIDSLCTGDTLTRTLHAMLPEARLFCSKGINIVPYLEPGSSRLARSTTRAITEHDIVLWRKHGVLAVGPDPIEAFDTIDIMEKAADIYLRFQTLQSALLHN
ncbi:MAG: rhamnulose-1-phosphate aldolase [Bacteroidales bacterium]|nr:rhamnulose-1-phosphate aldolase [Bacteroidales bacterium]